MAANRKLLFLPGDGIGPEVMAEVRRIIDWMDARRGVGFDITEGLVGGAAYEATGTPFPDETLEAALASDAVLFGAVGGPQWDGLDFSLRPERGLLGLRKELDLFVIDEVVGRGLPLWLPNGTVLRDELEKLAMEFEFKFMGNIMGLTRERLQK